MFTIFNRKAELALIENEHLKTTNSGLRTEVDSLNRKLRESEVKLSHYEKIYGYNSDMNTVEGLLRLKKEVEFEKIKLEADKHVHKETISLDVMKKELEYMKKYQDKLETLLNNKVSNK